MAASMEGNEAGSSFFWSPRNVTIAPGGSVTFFWTGGAAHDVSVPAIGFESPKASAEGSYTATFPSPGSYQVLCIIHPNMKGTVIVQ